MERRSAGVACSICSSSQPETSILGPAAIAWHLSHRDLWSELNENHAMAASRHDATLTSTKPATTPVDATSKMILTSEFRHSEVVRDRPCSAIDPDEPWCRLRR